jgi:hypothetical protein
LELLVDKQLQALIYVGMGRLQVEYDDMRGCSRTETDDGQEARSLETIGDVHCHPEHYEGKRERPIFLSNTSEASLCELWA